MGKDWDRFNVRGKRPVIGEPDGSKFRQNVGTPSFTGSGNLTCRSCGGDKYRNGDRKCRCGSPDFGNPAGRQLRAFQDWCTEWAAEWLRVLKPGGHLLAFGGTRTAHRLASGIEDAGFEIRDSVMWIYGAGFPKSLDVSKAIDKAAGAEREVVGTKLGLPGYSITNGNGDHRTYGKGLGNTGSGAAECAVTAPTTDAAKQWQGWGTALRPSHEPIVVARKPLSGTVARNVIQHGTGAMNIGGCRVGPSDYYNRSLPASRTSHFSQEDRPWKSRLDDGEVGWSPNSEGRWPANVVLDEAAAAELDRQSGEPVSRFFPVFPQEVSPCGVGSIVAANTSAGKSTGSKSDSSRTGGYGSKPTGLSPMDMKSTTGTTIPSTTTSTTSCVLPHSGTTTTINDSANSTGGSTASSIDDANGVTPTRQPSNSRSAAPEPSTATVAPALPHTAANGSPGTAANSMRDGASGTPKGSAPDFPVFRYTAKASSAERPSYVEEVRGARVAHPT